MLQFQMTHVALVGARMDAFQALGYRHRSELAMRRVVPAGFRAVLDTDDRPSLHVAVAQTLPFWVHNAISDSAFPAQERLAMGLRRFEGELRDNRDNEVVAAVLSAGFRNRTLDPLHPPDSMPMRQRCSLLMNIGPWKDAYQRLQGEFCAALCEDAGALTEWLATAADNAELSPSDAA